MPTSRERSSLAVRVGEQIAQLRKQKGWNQADLGRRCGVGQKRISEIECGVKSMSLDSLDGVARALGVNPYVLLLPEPGKPVSPGHVRKRELLGRVEQADEASQELLGRVMEALGEYRVEKRDK